MKGQALTIFASGSGTNAENIIQYFQENTSILVDSIFTNKPDAYVIERAKIYQIPYFVFNRTQFYETEEILEFLKKRGVQWIILAGFLWLVPEYLIQAYPNRIINIHPALLPKYGGKGMYGMRVHETIIKSGDTASGITIHYVNPEYDKGNIIFQAKCSVHKNDTPESLAQKVHQLEYEHFPRVIEEVILSKES